MGGVVGNIVGELTGSNKAANAAGKAAQAREAALRVATGYAREGLTSAETTGTRSLKDAQSPQELRALTAALRQQETGLNRQAELFASLDPAILEASQQALKLLRGEDASALAPIKNQRAQQRQALLDRLREQLGPGAETSTAGIQALNQFDQETTNVMSGAQQQGLSQLFGIAQGGAVNRGALGEGAMALGNIGGMFGQRAGRMSNARINAEGLKQGAFSNLINAQTGAAASAGSQFVSDQLKGQAQMSFMDKAIGAGAAYLTGGMGGGGAANSAGGSFLDTSNIA